MEGAHVFDEAARDRGRKGQRYADRLGQGVGHIRERNPDQSRDRDDDDILPQQHGETLSRGLRARRCKLWGNTHRWPRHRTAVYERRQITNEVLLCSFLNSGLRLLERV